MHLISDAISDFGRQPTKKEERWFDFQNRSGITAAGIDSGKN
jgi:hypothetical protein